MREFDFKTAAEKLLTNDIVNMLGYIHEYKGQQNLFIEAKGNSKKYYFPDYLITVRGIPMIVVEAKKPGEDLSAGYSEARLYAQEFNATLPHGINACQVVIASNGDTLWATVKNAHKKRKVKLNFTKFLIGKDGQIVARFEPTEDMKNVAKKVRELL